MTTEISNVEFAFPLKDFSPGMTLRDYFAAQAMQGYITGDYDVYPGEIAERAYLVADAMFKEHAREANVIAAAPDLYAALYRLLDVVYDKKGDDREQAIQHALAVMEKARGGENE